jgi:hypothetical protein
VQGWLDAVAPLAFLALIAALSIRLSTASLSLDLAAS